MDAPPDTAARIVTGEAFACNPETAAVIAARARLRDHPAHSVIIGIDHHHDHVHLLLDGQARMMAFAIDGRLVAIEDFARGDLLGEAHLFDPAAPGHEIGAVTRSSSAAFGQAVFLDLMTNYSCVALAVSRRLVARLSRITQRMVEGATLSANGRIHAELLRQAQAGTDLTIRPAPVLAQFALHVQSTRETVSRAINALEKRGIIVRDETALRVVAPHRLEELIF
ncbi:Crp/Fnr family transcriptional regulator [Novosphingobium acidiphilum]|uniref:Crp/Fnr family transcriptional regulator n=1 Tax=Novosphingobium acidiphilum TaxID=505248 RepID=UPI0003FF4357|nr:Crp/Fnr family transcriptional regulator [Novosphingobium acidiphilum]